MYTRQKFKINGQYSKCRHHRLSGNIYPKPETCNVYRYNLRSLVDRLMIQAFKLEICSLSTVIKDVIATNVVFCKREVRCVCHRRLVRAEQKRERSEKHQYKPITCVHKTRGIRSRVEKKTRATSIYVRNGS